MNIRVTMGYGGVKWDVCDPPEDEHENRHGPVVMNGFTAHKDGQDYMLDLSNAVNNAVRYIQETNRQISEIEFRRS